MTIVVIGAGTFLDMSEIQFQLLHWRDGILGLRIIPFHGSCLDPQLLKEVLELNLHSVNGPLLASVGLFELLVGCLCKEKIWF